MSTLFSSAGQLLAAQGLDLGRTDWLLLNQERIDLFAEATGDHQWIHVDPVRAASGPFGACIAHGYLTLALANLFMPQLMQFANLAMLGQHFDNQADRAQRHPFTGQALQHGRKSRDRHDALQLLSQLRLALLEPAEDQLALLQSQKLRPRSHQSVRISRNAQLHGVGIT